MKKLTVFFVMMLTLRASTSVAEELRDHLEPAEATWSNAQNEIILPTIAHSVFHEAWENDVRLWAYTPRGGLSIDQDSMMILRVRGSHYRVVFLESPVSLFSYTDVTKRVMHTQPEPADYRDIKPARCEVGISKILGDRIIAAWHDTMMNARFYETPQAPGVDSGWWMFSLKSGYRELVGGVPEPSVGQPHNLIMLAASMGEFCKTKTKSALTDVETYASAFVSNSSKWQKNERPH